MTGKQLKAWANTLHDDAIVEYNNYSWDTLDAKKLRAMLVSSPPLQMEDVCNLEDARS